MQWLEGGNSHGMFQAAVHYGIPMVNVHDAYAVNQKHSDKVGALMNHNEKRCLSLQTRFYLDGVNA